jgi:hypothetical protein
MPAVRRRRGATPSKVFALGSEFARARDICLDVEDHSKSRRSAADFFQTSGARDPNSQAARLAAQFEQQNRPLLSLMGVQLNTSFDGNSVWLHLLSGSMIGAIPLISPTTGSSDYGLVVKPRFPWAGLGPMLSEMGWRITPSLLKLPLLKRSERRVPPWVISYIVLTRLKALLESLVRRFEMTSEVRSTPRGRIAFDVYARRGLATGQPLQIPCTFPDLRDDSLLKGSIRFALERHLRSLETQREHGTFIHKLIEFCQQLLRMVQSVPLYVPSTTTIRGWLQRPMRSEYLTDGIQAIEWTLEDRGLAGLSDLEGIPWNMSMDQFFEAWVETVFASVARKTGAILKTGRKRETVHPINWEPAYLGSQRALIPDIWLEWESTTMIVDAKYKRHWHELQKHSWSEIEEELREQHRADLLQVLAYGTVAQTRNVTACLVYPCTLQNWQYLKESGNLFHRAQLPAGNRSVSLWLTAVPMGADAQTVSLPLEAAIRSFL